MACNDDLSDIDHPERHPIFVSFLHGTSNLDDVAPQDVFCYPNRCALKTSVLEGWGLRLDVSIVEGERVRMVGVNGDKGYPIKDSAFDNR